MSLKNLTSLSYNLEDKNFENIFMDENFSLHALTSTFLAISYLLICMSIYIIPLSYTITIYFSFYLFQSLTNRFANKATIFRTEYAFILIAVVGLIFLIIPDVIMPDKLPSLGDKYLGKN